MKEYIGNGKTEKFCCDANGKNADFKTLYFNSEVSWKTTTKLFDTNTKMYSLIVLTELYYKQIFIF